MEEYVENSGGFNGNMDYTYQKTSNYSTIIEWNSAAEILKENLVPIEESWIKITSTERKPIKKKIGLGQLH